MKSRKKIEIVQVLVIILISFVANFAVEMRIDFSASIDIIAVVKLCLICLATYLFNFKVYFLLLEEFEQSQKEYEAQSSNLKMSLGIDDIFNTKIKSSLKSIYWVSTGVAFLLFLFFFLEAIVKLLLCSY